MDGGAALQTLLVPDWAHDPAAAAARIGRRWGTLKIVLKVKDQPDLARAWVEHHAAIVGLANLVVFDNGSSDPALLDLYASLAGRLLVIPFAGFHNDLHDTRLVPELYRALADCCLFFCVLDADERLVLFDGEGRFANEAACRFLEENQSLPVLPGTWFYNEEGSATRIACGTHDGYIKAGLTWGKPLIRADAGIAGLINHNVQLDPAWFSASTKVNFFVLHLANLSRAGRIASNLRKLAARGVIGPEDGVAELLALDLPPHLNRNILDYASEIRRLSAQPDFPQRDGEPLSPGLFATHGNGAVAFFSQAEHRLLAEYVRHPAAILAAMHG